MNVEIAKKVQMMHKRQIEGEKKTDLKGADLRMAVKYVKRKEARWENGRFRNNLAKLE